MSLSRQGFKNYLRSARPTRWIIAFVVAIGLLATVGWLNSRHVDRMQETAKWVNDSERGRDALDLLLLQLHDVQGNERGYVVTGDAGFLERFNAAIKDAQDQFKVIRRLTADDRRQRGYCDKLEGLVARVFQISNRRVDLRKTAGFEAAQKDINGGEGRQVMAQISALLGQMDEEEATVLEERSNAAQKEVRLTRLFTIAGTAISLLLIGGEFFLVVRENRLRQEAQAELDSFFTLSLDMLCISSADGYFKRLNPAFTITLGYTTSELLSRPILDFVHPDDHAATLREIERQVRQGEPVLHFENRYRHKNGSWRVLSWKSVPHPHGQMFATARDVTEQKEREAQVVALNEALRARAVQVEAANKELESFSYSVSHDLRAPLRHVHGYVEMLQRATDGQLSDKAKRYLKTISDASIEMGQLIDDLLAFSRMGRVELQEARVALEPLVRGTVAIVERQALDRNITWKISPLPEVYGDPSMLKQVLVNLIENSVKYSRKREHATIEITTAGEEHGRTVFCVKDNGAGFDMQYAHKLFGVFQRLHRADEFEGTGIGLATVRRIIARHGGRTWAEGKLGEGASFYFTLKVTSQN